jgi:tRNA threonylcarbamoyladenosine biosynthesis protein TsaE
MEKILLTELDSFAQKVIERLPSDKKTATVLALKGDLGAGKTTFVQSLAKALGVITTVQSPTYVLMKSYDLSNPSTSLRARQFTKLIHIDAYRLNDPKEFAALKPEEFLKNSQNLVCIEWPERVEAVLPKPDLTLEFSSTNATETERYIQFN